MSPVPTSVWAIPDLALLICPADPDPWSTDFYVLYSTTFLGHVERIREYGFRWALSDELRIQLLGEFPWSALGTVGWVRDLMLTLPGWLESVVPLPVDRHQNAQILPNITPPNASRETEDAWCDVLVTCATGNEDLSYIASSPVQSEPCLHVFVNDELVRKIELIRKIQEWDVVLSQVDQWARHNLPRVGQCCYSPPSYWQPAQPLPNKRSNRGIGFVDAEDRIWVWDHEENHWDIQYQPEGHGQYFRVTSDGRRLG